MQLVINKLKSLLGFFRSSLPGFLLVLIFAGFSYIGVFIEEEPLLMLRGGFDNIYVVGVFYLLAQTISWLICFYVFKYHSLFETKINYLLVPVLSIVFLLCIQVVYYATVFYLLTGLILWEINFLFAPELDKQFAILLFILLNASVITGLIANFTGIYIQARKSPDKQRGNSAQNTGVEGDQNTSAGNGDSSETTSSFEDSISI